MKIFLAIVLGMIAFFIYGCIGAGVFIVYTKLDGSDWKAVIRSGDEHAFAFGCIVSWPLILSFIILIAPVVLIMRILEKMSER